MGCCPQDLFNTAHSILVELPSSFFSIRLISVHVLQPYNSMNRIAAWKKLRFTLLDRSNLHMKLDITSFTPFFMWLIGWLVGFYGILTFVGYLMPNPFYMNNQFYFKQSSLVCVHSLSKSFLFQAIQFSQTVLIQTIQFRLSTQFSSIWPIDRTLIRCCHSGIAMKGCCAFPKAPASLEPHHQIV